MGREKKTSLAAVSAGRTAKDRHQKTARDNNACTAPIRTDLIALPEKNITSKYKSYFQIFENYDKKEKKLEFEVTTNKIPPPGFEFVPIGNPELTKACKDLSRERDAMIFIVSTAKDANANKLALQMSRSGHHIRRTIVEEARALIGEEDAPTLPNSGEPEPIPDSQEEYNAQADAALRDLFPRIPNTDRQMIIEHAFKKGGTFQGQPVVGMVESLPLSRRVQLAVLAHIRHNHTRYDQLLREADYQTARKVVEQHCLDFLVKWRGDEETGRDQFDEILREVIVLSDDSDEDSEDDESSDEESVPIHAASGSRAKLTASPRAGTSPRRHTYAVLSRPTKVLMHKHPMPSAAQGGSSQRIKPQRSKKTNRGFKRYEAVAKRWEEAVNRNRYEQNAAAVGHASPMDRMPSQGPRRLPSLEIISPVPRAESPRHPYVTLASSHFHHGGHYQSQPHRPNDRPPVADFEPQRHAPVARYADPQSAPQPGYQSAPSEAMIVGRRITRVPVSSDRQSGPAPQRSYHEELKDYLIPSIEPPSPHSGPDLPLFVRQVIRGGPTDPEQVPSGRSVPYSHPLPLQIHTGDFRHDQSHPGNGGRPRPAMPSHVGEQVVTQREYYYGPQPNLAMSAPEHARRVYRVREPIEDNRRSREIPVITSKSVIRVQREASPPGSWKPDLSRMRVFSPPRMNQYTARTLPSMAYENAEPRRVFYREASASRFDGYEQGPGSSSAQLHHRDAPRPPSPGFWHGSTFDRPDAHAPVRPKGTAVHQGYPSRLMFREMSPTHQVVEGYNHRGHAYQEAPQTTQHARSVSSDVKYMYEQPVPNRDVVMLRQ